MILTFRLLCIVYSCTWFVRGDNCCWCGKRYVAKEGYYEGSKSDESEASKIEQKVSASHEGTLRRHRALNFSRIDGEHIFPFGMFVSWGGWLGTNISMLDLTVGNIVQPVSPFTPGGLDAVEHYLEASRSKDIRWNFDLKHVYRDEEALREQVSQREHGCIRLLRELSETGVKSFNIVRHVCAIIAVWLQVTRFSKHKAILGWYLADEPDGAGTTEGNPIGVDPSVVRSAYLTVKSIDSHRPVLVSLNCMHSAPYYQDTADIFLVDPYPISINTHGCTTTYGCCGCDDCDGLVTDVSRRLDHVGSILQGAKAVWLVVQAFGGEGHWERQPTPREVRAMTYLGLQHGEYKTNM